MQQPVCASSPKARARRTAVCQNLGGFASSEGTYRAEEAHRSRRPIDNGYLCDQPASGTRSTGLRTNPPMPVLVMREPDMTPYGMWHRASRKRPCDEALPSPLRDTRNTYEPCNRIENCARRPAAAACIDLNRLFDVHFACCGPDRPPEFAGRFGSEQADRGGTTVREGLRPAGGHPIPR